MTGVAHQVFQELKLSRQEFDDLVAALHRAGQQIELQIGDAKPGLGRSLGATAEQCLDARQQLAERKGLDEIIVAPGAQPLHAVIDTAERGEDQRGGADLRRPQCAEDRQPVHAGEHAVEHDRVIAARSR